MYLANGLSEASFIGNSRKDLHSAAGVGAADDSGDDMNSEENSEYIVSEFILSICQIICFPFAIDANEEIITRTYKILKEFNLFNKIISACISQQSTLVCDIPVSLVARLILSDEDLVQLMIDQLNNSPQVAILNAFLSFLFRT